MADLDTPVSSLPSRPLEMEQALAQLEDSRRFEAIIHSEKTIEVEEPSVYVYDLVFITEGSVSAVVYIEDDETWYIEVENSSLTGLSETSVVIIMSLLESCSECNCCRRLHKKPTRLSLEHSVMNTISDFLINTARDVLLFGMCKKDVSKWTHVLISTK